ncbi:M20 family metallopeptidase [Sulfobacillus harzensis]|uniref:M20 family metallopeptidase n=1 Tax=Sulfobacillus harzensis TaxID=2729629 RepID=A0A7Y0L649_9FIRM|nr:M20/M25/M40 family metallo-hydrolase [Sulfobacillus harzensis]NMP23647.1 M20 family metallopeptidase [Sulfobacillus harzensis]
MEASLQSRLMSRIRTEEIVEKLAELVETPSVVEDGQTESQVMERVAAWCKADGLAFRTWEVSPGRPNLEIEWKGSAPGPILLFEAHSDTVTAGDLSHWTRPAFQLTQEDDRLYGRGTADTKGNLVAAYIGLREFVRLTDGAFAGTLRLLVPVDEEGMMSGIREYIASGRAHDVEAAVCCEPEDAQVCIRQKGALRLRVEICGKMAHGAMPLTGNNPLPVAARFIEAMAEEERYQQESVGFDSLLGWPSITPTQIQAPLSGVGGFNVVPDAVAISLDIRTIVGQSHEKLIARIQERLNSVIEEANHSVRMGRVKALRDRLEEPIDAGLYRASLILVDDRPVTDTPKDHAVVRAVAAAVAERLNAAAVFSGVPGATDGTWLWDAGIPIVTTGAGNRFVPHQADEWVSLAQLRDATVIFADSAYRFFTDSHTGRRS